ncbi:MAG TPA: hypothetical protein PLC04_04180 [Candidatus Kapabacteria bacterium]|nr:hypothetical protein [Candidatus Kapabacteria bacterium]
MSTTVAKKILLYDFPLGWVYKVDLTATPKLALKWSFDNLKPGSWKAPSPQSAAAGDNLDIERGDGAKYRFPAETLVLDGVTEEIKASTSSDETKLGEITLVTNEGAVESNSMSAFYKDVLANRDELFLVIVGTGFSHDSKTNLKSADGFVVLLGKITNDIEGVSDHPKSLTLTFSSYKNSTLVATDLTSLVIPDITWKLGGTGYDATGMAPDAITADEAADLLAGKLVIKPNVTYTYA